MISERTYSDPDKAREAEIEQELSEIEACYSRGERDAANQHWVNAVWLIERRRPEVVREMERARGIA